MKKEQRNFYAENEEFVDDLLAYCEGIKKEFDYIMNEVSGNTLKCENFNIGIIPFKSKIEGILLNIDSKYIKEFKCDDIRAEIGAHVPLSEEIMELAKEDFYCEEDELNIKKCELYYNNNRYPYIQRHGGQGISSEQIHSKMQFETNNKALFVSNWIEFGPFCIFFVAELNEKVYLKYRELANTKEDDDNLYKYFLDTLIDNFFEKWLEFIYYGLSYSTINYISDSHAIIAASANDMFESRQIPTEHIFTKIANYEYEGTPCKGKIVFTDNVNDIVRFKQPVALSISNAKKIRKMLEMSNEKNCLVATSYGEIIGLDSFSNHKESYLLEFINVNMWDLSYDGKHIVEYHNGQYKLPKNKFDNQLFIEKCNERFNGNYDKDIVKIIESASCQGHGTMVIISPKAKSESEALIKDGKGTAIYERNLIRESKDLVLGLSSIDGAIMIDPFGKCSGIGLILSNPNSGKGNPERGSRYNSAVNYINSNKNSIAVVISEDGMIDIL